VIWRAFRKPQADPAREAWWRDADEEAGAPQPGRLDALTHAMAPSSAADEHEGQTEMIDGLQALAALRAREALPVVLTQHRAIGADACHFLAPAALVGEPGAGGKLFLTSERLVFVGGRSVAWPWHRVRQFRRHGREVLVTAAGAAEPLHLHCGNYGDALVAAYVIARLSRAE
jgi:hypothetical protein